MADSEIKISKYVKAKAPCLRPADQERVIHRSLELLKTDNASQTGTPRPEPEATRLRRQWQRTLRSIQFALAETGRQSQLLVVPLQALIQTTSETSEPNSGHQAHWLKVVNFLPRAENQVTIQAAHQLFSSHPLPPRQKDSPPDKHLLDIRWMLKIELEYRLEISSQFGSGLFVSRL